MNAWKESAKMWRMRSKQCAKAYRDKCAKLDKAKAVILEVEWIAEDEWYYSCPWCGNLQKDGHSPDCSRQQTLAELEQE